MTEEKNFFPVFIVSFYFILLGAFAGAMITGCCIDSSHKRMLCQKFYTSTPEYIACLNKPIKEIIKEINK